MSRRLVFWQNVEIELAEAVDWFDAALGRIAQNPFLYQIIEDDIRRAPLHRFPYGFMYVVSEDELLILTCFHGSRDPRDWQEMRGR
jgi:hypothetical protein